MTDVPDSPSVPVSADGPHGPVRLKWHQLRTHYAEAPFKPRHLALGWRLGASLEIDILAAADQRFLVAHDATLGPATTGRGRVAGMRLDAMTGLVHRDRAGRADPDAPLLALADLLAPLRAQPRAPGTSLQVDLKLQEGGTLAQAAVEDAVAAVAGIEEAIVVGSHVLGEARRLVAAMPGARLGYDPMRAASRDPALARDPRRLFRHMERRRAGLAIAYLRFDVVVAAEAQGFPLVARLLDLGIETDAWTLNPGPSLSDAVLDAVLDAKVRQITTDAPIEIAQRIARL